MDNKNSSIEKLEKRNLGKFYTENYNYIFQGFNLPDLSTTHFIEPFVGMGHLINFLKNYYNVEQNHLNIEYYDLDNNIEGVVIRDTLMEPPNYDNKYVITNPPFLARNKNDNKEIYDKYGNNDLYKCFLKTLIHSQLTGGMLILPINFLSSTRTNDNILRHMFLERFKIIKLNIFEEKVFKDTTYNVISFIFKRREDNEKNPDDYIIPTVIFPMRMERNYELSNRTNWMIGGDIYDLAINSEIFIGRSYERNDGKIEYPNTRIFLNTLDDGMDKYISLKYLEQSEDLYIGKESDRTFATLIIRPELTEDKQRDLVRRFNKFLNQKRREYHSMFLVNFRESKKSARKRISFQLVYRILNHLIINPSIGV